MATPWDIPTRPTGTILYPRSEINSTWTLAPDINTYLHYNDDLAYNSNYRYDGVIAGTPWNTRIIP